MFYRRRRGLTFLLLFRVFGSILFSRIQSPGFKDLVEQSVLLLQAATIFRYLRGTGKIGGYIW